MGARRAQRPFDCHFEIDSHLRRISIYGQWNGRAFLREIRGRFHMGVVTDVTEFFFSEWGFVEGIIFMVNFFFVVCKNIFWSIVVKLMKFEIILKLKKCWKFLTRVVLILTLTLRVEKSKNYKQSRGRKIQSTRTNFYYFPELYWLRLRLCWNRRVFAFYTESEL